MAGPRQRAQPDSHRNRAERHGGALVRGRKRGRRRRNRIGGSGPYGRASEGCRHSVGRGPGRNATEDVGESASSLARFSAGGGRGRGFGRGTLDRSRTGSGQVHGRRGPVTALPFESGPLRRPHCGTIPAIRLRLHGRGRKGRRSDDEGTHRDRGRRHVLAVRLLTLGHPPLGVRATTTAYPMIEAPRALGDLRHGRFSGAAVLRS